MKITHVRIRVLRSRATGYGHDAAEIEAQIEDGDDVAEVAAELRRRCEAEVRQGADASRALDRITDLYEKLKRLEDQVAAKETQIKEARDLIGQFENFLTAAQKAGVHVPAPLAQRFLIPF